jgi:invasion protein IalB
MSLMAVLSVFLVTSTSVLAQDAEPKPAAPAPKPAAKAPAKPAAPAAAPKAAATENVEPDVTTATYGAWVLRCQKLPDRRICEINQTLSQAGDANPFALIAVGRTAADAPLKLVAQVPPNAALADAPALSVGGKAYPAKFVRCLPGGCFIETDLSDDLDKAMRTSTEPASIAFKNGQDQPVKIELNLNGFTNGMAALKKEK